MKKWMRCLFLVMSLTGLQQAHAQPDNSGKKNNFSGNNYSSYLAHIAAANASIRLHDGAEAQRWLTSTPVEYRGWEYNYLKNTIQGYTHSFNLLYEANEIDLSNDGKKMAIAGADSLIHICSADGLVEQKTYKGHTNTVYAVDYFGNDTKLVSCARDFTIRVWDTQNDIQLWKKTTKAQGICDVVGSPDGKLVALSSWYRDEDHNHVVGFIEVYDAFTGELKWETTFGEKPLVAITFSHDGKLLAAAGWNWAVAVWDVQTKEKKHAFNFDDVTTYSAIDDLVFSADDAYLMATSRNTTARVWNMYTGTIQFELKGHENAVYAGDFTNDGTLMITGSADGSLILWSTETGLPVNSLFGHQSVITDITMAPDGNTFYTLANDKTIKTWSLKNAAPYSNPSGQNGLVYGFNISKDNQYLVTQGDNGILTVWNNNDGSIVKQFPTFGGIMNAAAISPDNNYVVGCNWEGRIKVWELFTGKKAIEFAGINAGVVGCTFSPDGKQVAVAAYDSTITIWDLASGARLHQLKHSGLMYNVTYSPNGKYIVGSSTNGAVTIWLNDSFTKLHEVKTSNGAIYQCAFGPDNVTFAAVGESKEIYIIAAGSGKILRKIPAHNERIYSVAWSPDGSRIATGSSDNTVRLWDVNTDQTTLIIADFKEDIYHVIFSSDNTALYVNSPGSGFKKYATN